MPPPQDNDLNRFILGKRLNMSGHTVVNTTNGQEAVEMIESDKDFDLVFMDIQ
jgi:CheY-like chemotaxis protein